MRLGQFEDRTFQRGKRRIKPAFGLVRHACQPAQRVLQGRVGPLPQHLMRAGDVFTDAGSALHRAALGIQGRFLARLGIKLV